MRVYKTNILQELTSVLTTEGAPFDVAESISYALLLSEMSGESAHGLRIFNKYRDLLHNLDANSKIELLKETSSFSVVDSAFLPGLYTAKYCMQVAIDKARENGMYAVLARHANTYGSAFVYTLQAAQQGIIGVTMANTPAQMPVFEGKKKMLGTNPLSYAIPAKDELPILFDMASSKVAKSRINQACEQQQDVPADWGLDKDGKGTTSPKEILEGGFMLPFANSPKGYGIAMMVDLFSGMLSGAACLDDVGFFKSGKMNVGQLFVAIDPRLVYGEHFYIEMDSYIRKIKESGENVRLPGENKLLKLVKAEKEGFEVEDNIYKEIMSKEYE